MGRRETSVGDAVRALLADGRPRALEEIAEALADALPGDGDDALAAVEEALEGDPFVLLPDDRFVDGIAALEGRAFTHRLTAEEAADGTIPLLPDLEALAWPATDVVPLAAGGEGRLIPMDAGGDALGGPSGWLGVAGAGDVVVLRWAGGAVQVATGVPDPGETDRLAAALAAAHEACAGRSDRGALLVDVVFHAVVDDPEAFTAIAPPLAELLEAAGLERRGEWVGPAGSEWLDPFEASQAADDRMLEAAYGFGPCCHAAIAAVRAAFARHLIGEAPDDRAAVLDALAHEEVAEAFGREVLGWTDSDLAEPLAGFAEALAGGAGGRRAAPARFLAGLAHEARGDLLAAERAHESAIAADPELGAALAEAAWYAELRGDARRAADLLRRARVPEDDAQLARLEAETPRPSKVPRNAPCPCGSGRKHKACCLGRPAPVADRAGWLHARALAFAHRPEHRGLLIGLAERVLLDEAPEPERLFEALGDPLLLDLALFEGGALAEFLEVCGPLLPADELAMGSAWLDRPRALLDVGAARPGEGLEVRDARTGETAWVSDPFEAPGPRPGDLALARLVPAGDGLRLVGPVMLVPLAQRDDLVRLTGGDAGLGDWLEWLRATRAPPRMATMDGDDVVFCEAAYRLADPAAARGLLAAALDAGADGDTFHAHVEARGEEWLSGTARVDGDELVLETNSRERMERLRERLAGVLAAAELLGERETPLREALEGHAAERAMGLAPDPPPPPDAETKAAIDALMADYADRWVDEEVPALGGLTPRQAADDPTRREDLLALLREFERSDRAADPTFVGMPVARIRRTLRLGPG
jgi:hypothetical protein